MTTAAPVSRGGGGNADRQATRQSFYTANPRCPQAQPDRPPNWRAVGSLAAAIVADVRRQRQAIHLHRLGPRPVLEALIETAAGADLDNVLRRFAAINPAVVRALGAGRFPSTMFAVST